MKIIDRLRTYWGLKLLVSPSFTATAWELKEAAKQYRCVHCGKNPYIKSETITKLKGE
jgi:hypothetical protein